MPLNPNQTRTHKHKDEHKHEHEHKHKHKHKHKPRRVRSQMPSLESMQPLQDDDHEMDVEIDAIMSMSGIKGEADAIRENDDHNTTKQQVSVPSWHEIEVRLTSFQPSTWSCIALSVNSP